MLERPSDFLGLNQRFEGSRQFAVMLLRDSSLSLDLPEGKSGIACIQNSRQNFLKCPSHVVHGPREV
jgi:hypothetical protein